MNHSNMYWPEKALKEALGCKDDDILGAIKKLKQERERCKSNCDYFAGIAQDRLRDHNKLELELREALGTIDEYADVIGLVRKLKQERDELKDKCDGLTADLELTNRIYKEHHDFVDKVCEAVDIQRPYIESGYDNAVGLIAGFKRERDELKEKCDKMKKRANAVYGTSCGKEPAFFCYVSSYSWNIGSTGSPFRDDSISVTLELTPTANYNGTFDLEDLKKYIQAYGREKKLSDFEVFCKLVNDCIDELCDKYNVVQPVRSQTTRERLDYIFGVLDEYRELADGNYKRVEGLRKEKKEFLDSVCEVLNIAPCTTYKQILTEVKDLTDDADRYDELEDFRADICGALDIEGMLGTPKQNDKYILDQVEKLKEDAGHDKLFRDSVCDALDATTAVSDSYLFKKIEKLKLDHKETQERYSRYCLAVGSLCNIPAEHREDISWIEDSFNHTKKDYLKLKDDADKLARFRSNVCTALCLGGETYYEEILKSVMEIRESHDKLARLRSNICSEFSLVPENCDGNIIGHIHMMQDCHEKLCKDYTELRKAIWDAMGKNRETQPGDDERLVGEVTELKRGEKLLIEFRDDVAKSIGMDYPTTNQVILNRVKYLYKDREDAYGMVSKLNDQVTALEKAKDDLQQKFEFQSGLRQQWHVRYESEHERANGVQKALDREREKSRVKDISLETAKKQYEKVCGNLETAECALNGMKSKIRELQEELNAERHSNLTEDNETHPIDTDPGYLRSGEEDSEE